MPCLLIKYVPNCTSRFGKTVDVLEPKNSYCIHRRPPYSKIKPSIYCLAKKKVAVLTDKIAKQELNKERKVCF